MFNLFQFNTNRFQFNTNSSIKKMKHTRAKKNVTILMAHRILYDTPLIYNAPSFWQ